MSKINTLVVAIALLFVASSVRAAPIIFDDFNTNLGHFGYEPEFSGQSVGESTLSTNVHTTTEAVEGAGAAEATFVHDGSGTNLRIRYVSGGPPYNSTNAGNPAANNTFTTSAGTDGFIGFYLKTMATGYTVGLNLDDSTNTGGGMDMGAAKSVIADGEWHLYEWNLDDNAQWVAVPSIGGGGGLQDGQHSVDSIYFFANATGAAGEADPPIFIDFVAKSDSGSIANLVPEPASLGLLALAGLALRRRRR